MYTINIWPIIIATIVAFGIGSLWYSPILFGKEWLALLNISADDIEEAKKRGMWKPYLSTFIANLISFAVLGFIIAVTAASSGTDGAFLGLITWIGFIVPAGLSRLLWRREHFKLVLIDTMHTLLILIVGGAIIGAWK